MENINDVWVHRRTEYYGAAHENIQFGQDMSVESLLEFVMNVFK